MKNMNNDLSAMMEMNDKDLAKQIKETVKQCMYTTTHTTIREAATKACSNKVMSAVVDTTLADLGNGIADMYVRVKGTVVRMCTSEKRKKEKVGTCDHCGAVRLSRELHYVCASDSSGTLQLEMVMCKGDCHNG